MKKDNIDINVARRFRKKAEEHLKKRGEKTALQITETDALKLIHELEVHQIELEMQNEELTLAKNKLSQINAFNEVLLQTIPFKMDIVDENGTILFQNKKLIQQIGEEGIGKKCWAVYREDKAKCLTCPLNAEIKPGETRSFESDSIFKGKTYEVLHTGMIFQGRKALLKLFIDITQRKRVEQIQTVLYNISNAITSTDNLEGTIGLIRDELGTILDTTNMYVALFDDSNNSLSFPFFADEKNEVMSYPAEKELIYYIIRTQSPLLATKEKLRKLEQSGKIEITEIVSKIWLGVPLRVNGKTTGVLAVQSYTDGFAYNESDMELLLFISGQISICIDRKMQVL